MQEVPKFKVVGKLIRFFEQGAICPAEFWQAIESIVAPAELGEVFERLDEDDQGAVRKLFHERPLPLRAMEDQDFRGQLRKWVASSPPRMPGDDCSRFIFLGE